MRNIRYIGTANPCKAFHLQTGIIWIPNMVDTVLDEDVAKKMLKHPEFQDAGDSVGASRQSLASDPVAALSERLTKLTKLRAAIAGARNNNPQVLSPWAPAPTWAISTAYGNGSVVRGTGADAVNLYFMAGSDTTALATGTSASSGTGPSGSGSAIIVDGTCRWQYIGRATAPTTIPLISTASLTTAASEMNGAVQLISSATASAIGLSVLTPADYSYGALITGGLWQNQSSGAVDAPNQGSVAVPSYQDRNRRGGIAVVTNSRKWVAFQAAGPVRADSPIEINVNGRRLSESQLTVPTDNTNNAILINMGLFPEGDKVIKIRCAGNLKNNLANRWILEAGATIRPYADSGIRMTVEGDSIAANSYITDRQSAYWFERILSDHLGIDLVYNNAVGGTGVINNVSGTKTTYLERLPAIVSYLPDIHVINGFHNDVGESGAYTSATRRQSIGAYLSACRAQMPSATLVIIGSQLLQGEAMTAGATNQWQVELDTKAAFDAFADANSLFIPVITPPLPLLNSANGPHYMVGSAPYGDSHPTPAYYPYIGGLIAEKIKAFVALL